MVSSICWNVRTLHLPVVAATWHAMTPPTTNIIVLHDYLWTNMSFKYVKSFFFNDSIKKSLSFFDIEAKKQRMMMKNSFKLFCFWVFLVALTNAQIITTRESASTSKQIHSCGRINFQKLKQKIYWQFIHQTYKKKVA